MGMFLFLYATSLPLCLFPLLFTSVYAIHTPIHLISANMPFHFFHFIYTPSAPLLWSIVTDVCAVLSAQSSFAFGSELLR